MTAAAPPLLRRLASWGWRIVRTLDPRRPSWVETLPRVTIEGGASVPAWVVHAGSAAVGLATAAVVVDGRGQWFVSILLAVPIALRPVGALPALFGGWMGVLVAFEGATPGPAPTAAVILGVHLVAVVTSVTAGLRPNCRVELAVFTGPLRRLLAIQVLVQPAVWGASVAARQGWALPWLGIVAAAALAALAWTVVLRTSEE